MALAMSRFRLNCIHFLQMSSHRQRKIVLLYNHQNGYFSYICNYGETHVSILSFLIVFIELVACHSFRCNWNITDGHQHDTRRPWKERTDSSSCWSITAYYSAILNPNRKKQRPRTSFEAFFVSVLQFCEWLYAWTFQSALPFFSLQI